MPYIASVEKKHLNHLPVPMPTCVHQCSLWSIHPNKWNQSTKYSIQIKTEEMNRKTYATCRSVRTTKSNPILIQLWSIRRQLYRKGRVFSRHITIWAEYISKPLKNESPYHYMPYLFACRKSCQIHDLYTQILAACRFAITKIVEAQGSKLLNPESAQRSTWPQ